MSSVRHEENLRVLSTILRRASLDTNPKNINLVSRVSFETLVLSRRRRRGGAGEREKNLRDASRNGGEQRTSDAGGQADDERLGLVGQPPKALLPTALGPGPLADPRARGRRHVRLGTAARGRDAVRPRPEALHDGDPAGRRRLRHGGDLGAARQRGVVRRRLGLLDRALQRRGAVAQARGHAEDVGHGVRHGRRRERQGRVRGGAVARAELLRRARLPRLHRARARGGRDRVRPRRRRRRRRRRQRTGRHEGRVEELDARVGHRAPPVVVELDVGAGAGAQAELVRLDDGQLAVVGVAGAVARPEHVRLVRGGHVCAEAREVRVHLGGGAGAELDVVAELGREVEARRDGQAERGVEDDAGGVYRHGEELEGALGAGGVLVSLFHFPAADWH